MQLLSSQLVVEFQVPKGRFANCNISYLTHPIDKRETHRRAVLIKNSKMPNTKSQKGKTKHMRMSKTHIMPYLQRVSQTNYW